MKLAFVGNAAVGKDTLAEYASRKLNLTNVSSGDLVREYIKENELGTIERENVRKVANQLRTAHGSDYLVRLACEKYLDNLIISGLRAMGEVETFKSLGGTVIAVTAPAERRFELAKSRNRIDDMVTFEEWKHAEEGDDNNTDKGKGNITAVIELADHVIENLGSLGELFDKFDEVI